MLTQFVDAEVLQNRHEAAHVTADGNESHQRKVFYKSAARAFWGLSRTDHAPVSVVELARFSEFARLRDWSVEPS